MYYCIFKLNYLIIKQVDKWKEREREREVKGRKGKEKEIEKEKEDKEKWIEQQFSNQDYPL